MLKRLKALLKGGKNYTNVDLKGDLHLRGKEVRVPYAGYPIQLELGSGGQRLQIHPELPLSGTPAEDAPLTFLIINPDSYLHAISGVMRLEPGCTRILGRNDPEQMALFNYHKGVSARHVTIANEGRALIIKDLHSDGGTTLSGLRKESDTQRLLERRRENLLAIRDIFGGPLRVLTRKDALFALKQVNHLMQREEFRPLDSQDHPGGVIQLPKHITPVLLGDLHAQVDNLLKILSENDFLGALERREACLIILGDAVHSEIDGELEEMDSSLLMMDLIFKLKIKYPKQVFYVRGNHDSFSQEVSKGGVSQGLLWAKHVRFNRGEEYFQEMVRFYSQLPYVVVSHDFVACHAAPPKAKTDLRLLIDVAQYPGLKNELIWNRVQRPNYQAGYTKGDVKRFRKCLDLEGDAPFIVAHNPLSRTHSVWLDVEGITGHHIVFSGIPHTISLFTRLNGHIMPLTMRGEKLLETVNRLPHRNSGEV